MNLTLRKFLVVLLIAAVLVLGNIVVIAHWLDEVGVSPLAERISDDFLTPTAVTIISALLILLVGPSRHAGSTMSCPVCRSRVRRADKYCPECGSRI
ncbi:hypothetical protein STSP2_01898 [Anaerohalosphaera lusitana]|uniref:Zinc-ribbon domain-containing protein n=1 Tax=Anaerohalosphaera lusitana TaxID=1936003 RepID=A0A1U9NMJ4_9BACT|nr:hypothetical protein [Anaerohalosphaera lusitana]AQT68726.1 hypothetical protein STSP2_01898 [Anaerohalosphaera lusitana]